MRPAIEAQSGTIVSTEGDFVFAVLRSAREALAAAIGAQRGLDEHHWPEGLGVRVRIGIHVGEAVFGGRDYTGIDVHRTARVMAAAWGGEILVSAAVAALVGESLPDGAHAARPGFSRSARHSRTGAAVPGRGARTEGGVSAAADGVRGGAQQPSDTADPLRGPRARAQGS